MMDVEMTQVNSPTTSDHVDDTAACVIPSVPANYGPPSISLAVILDFAIQRTLHEFTVLSEILPINDHPDRKKAIVQFAHATRLMFVKILAVVKWLRTSKKFESLSHIRYYLDAQASSFIMAADRLCELARVELQNARLPMFDVPTAVDMLTRGAPGKFPLCIRDALIPERKLSPSQTRQTILMLNERLVFHLVSAMPTLPKRVTIFRVYNGTIIMRVKGEFQVRITVVPTRVPEFLLLSVAILVKDYEIGGGMDLAHPIQLCALHDHTQKRMSASSQPFLEAYRIMHSFALNLQLDVLECQTRKLSSDIAPNYVKVESYDPYEGSLTVVYWLSSDRPSTGGPASSIGPSGSSQASRVTKMLSNSVVYRMTIFADKKNLDEGLIIRHNPPSTVRLIESVPMDRHVSMARILSCVIEVRIRERLILTRKLLSKVPPYHHVKLSGNATPTLSYELIVHEQASSPEEHLIVSINAFFGHIVCQVPALKGQHDELRKLEAELNGSGQLSTVSAIISRLRIILMIERYKRAISCGTVNLVSPEEIPGFNKIKGLPPDKLVLQFHRLESHYLVVVFLPSLTTGLEVKFYTFSTFLQEKLAMMEMDPFVLISQQPLPSCYKPLNIHSAEPEAEDGSEAMDTYGYEGHQPMEVQEHPARQFEASMANVLYDGIQPGEVDILEPRKRSPWTGEPSQIRFVIGAIEDRLCFVSISEELDRRKIPYDPVAYDPVIGGPMLRLTDLKCCASADSEDFFDNVVSVTLRLDCRRARAWPCEFVIRNTPLVPNFYQNSVAGSRAVFDRFSTAGQMIEYENERTAFHHRTKCFVQDLVIQLNSHQHHVVQHHVAGRRPEEVILTSILEKIAMYANLYGPVKRFARVYHLYKYAIDVMAYTYNKVVFAYGINRECTVMISCIQQPPSLNATQPSWGFSVCFGQLMYQPMSPTYDIIDVVSSTKRVNPHRTMEPLLSDRFKQTRDLLDLVNYLVHTCVSLQCLVQLKSLRMRSAKSICLVSGSDVPPVAFDFEVFFSVVDRNTIRVVVGPVHLEFCLLMRNGVAVRDVSPLKPLAVGLKAFVQRYAVPSVPNSTGGENISADNTSPQSRVSLIQDYVERINRQFEEPQHLVRIKEETGFEGEEYGQPLEGNDNEQYHMAPSSSGQVQGQGDDMEHDQPQQGPGGGEAMDVDMVDPGQGPSSNGGFGSVEMKHPLSSVGSQGYGGDQQQMAGGYQTHYSHSEQQPGSFPNADVVQPPQSVATIPTQKLIQEEATSYNQPKSAPQLTAAFPPPPSFHGPASASQPVFSAEVKQEPTMDYLPPEPDMFSSGGYPEADAAPQQPINATYATTREAIYINACTLATLFSDLDNSGALRIDNYLYALAFLSKIGTVIEPHRQTDRIGRVPLREIIVEPGRVAITASMVSTDLQGLNRSITLGMILDPDKFRLAVAIDFNHSEAPKDSDMYILKSYFLRCVAPLFNEVAVISFINLCRPPSPKLLDSVINLMAAQMNPDPKYHWQMSVQLAPLDTVQNSIQARPLGVGYSQGDTVLYLTICLWPRLTRGKERVLERRYYDIQFTLLTSAVTVTPLVAKDDSLSLQNELRLQQERSRQYNNCPLWPCVRTLLERGILMDTAGAGGAAPQP